MDLILHQRHKFSAAEGDFTFYSGDLSATTLTVEGALNILGVEDEKGIIFTGDASSIDSMTVNGETVEITDGIGMVTVDAGGKEVTYTLTINESGISYANLPVMTIDVNPDTWTTEDVVITVIASDDLNELSLQYSIDGGEWADVIGGQVIITENCTVTFKASDGVNEVTAETVVDHIIRKEETIVPEGGNFVVDGNGDKSNQDVLMQEGKTTVTVKDGADFVVGSILKENGTGSNDIRVGDDATMDITGLVENLGNVKVDDDARLYILSGVSDANSEVSAEDADQDQSFNVGIDSEVLVNGSLDFKGGKDSVIIGAESDMAVLGDLKGVDSLNLISGSSGDDSGIVVGGDYSANENNSIIVGNYRTLDIAGAVTPVPGGVGPMTVAMLMKNTYLIFLKKYKKRT